MNKPFIDQADTWYSRAERKAAHYYASLYAQVAEKAYVPLLTEDFRAWQRNRIRPRSWLSLLPRGMNKPDPRDDIRSMRWLARTGKLERYLHRSMSYIYMRDLGKELDNPATQDKIRRAVADVREQLTRSAAASRDDQPDYMSLAWLYRRAQKEGVESAVIWVIDKLKTVAARMPEELNPEHAQRKLIKIMVGVVMHAIDELDDEPSSAERARRIDEAVRLGYSYGLTYPFVDDLLDSRLLTAREKERYSALIRTALLTGTVPELGEWAEERMELIRYVHAELREAFDYIAGRQRPETRNTFFEQAYVFFHAQEADRKKDLSNPDYTNEDLYIPIILKSASSRSIVRSVIHAPADEGFDNRTFYYGIYNQLADDFADMAEDTQAGAVTPYTYYLKYRDRRPDLINPFELYWTVIAHLIHRVYRSDAETRDVILDRAINGLKRCKARLGEKAYRETMDLFASGHPEFNRLVQRMVRRADDVDFFDKLLRDQMVAVLRKSRDDKKRFLDTIETIRRRINDVLPIAKPDEALPMKETLIDAANYSLEGDGKRLRPILTWVMGVDEYGLDAAAIVPLLRSLEYMHTASLIFDDLPSQDNASTRRGRPTLHRLHTSATAELTGLFLIQKAIGEQASLDRFPAEAVLALMQYSARKAEDMCMGQAMDLEAKGKALTLEQLNAMCFYKTGVAFEACLVMPAILARVPEPEIAALKTYAYHAGIAFQIRDDLLDVEGDRLLLGKPVGHDAENRSSTFVTVLGLDGAKKAMWEHYCLAVEALKEKPRGTAFLKSLLNYMINRDR
ncbi:polyprenyl synthetase family protein [Paenibacillus flagellatus]|uniref:Geranyl transferase n=1 Tax=Paenibacillus flagellatus TaxID=2211139 RepID=A0A2V5K056_9BACL|nr:polyprenyl synthetase family protein [Paenibacillus flagellatus]PYI51004.1 geranyl transferase [Paenibacillus flagellatus]